MPYGDGTGPYGTGPLGWHRGSCQAGVSAGWPIWRGTRLRLTPAEERAYLAEEKQRAEAMLDEINTRLRELKK
ncbi:MAG: DUF5320 domain-containing protein [Patescibacteria group bacterium]